MIKVLDATSILFLSILSGFLFGWFKIFKEGASSLLIRYVFFMALPAGLFLACYKAKFALFNLAYLSSYISSTVAVIIIFFILSKVVLKQKLNISFMNTMPVSQVDGAYFTLPLITLLFGSAASIIPLMAIQNIIFFTFIIFLIELSTNNSNESVIKGKNKKLKYIKFIGSKMLGVLFKNPIILASIAGFAFAGFAVPLDDRITKFLHYFGESSSPVALFSLGLSFSISIKHIWKMKKAQFEVGLLTFGKLIVYPLLAWLASTLFEVPHELKIPLILMCASPAATHNFIIANQYKLNDETQTNVIVISTILSFATINLLIYFLP